MGCIIINVKHNGRSRCFCFRTLRKTIQRLLPEQFSGHRLFGDEQVLFLCESIPDVHKWQHEKRVTTINKGTVKFATGSANYFLSGVAKTMNSTTLYALKDRQPALTVLGRRIFRYWDSFLCCY